MADSPRANDDADHEMREEYGFHSLRDVGRTVPATFFLPVCPDLVAGTFSFGTTLSGLLEDLDGVDVNQAAVHDTVFIGIGDDDLRFRDRHALGMPDFVGFTVRETDDERLERLSANELSNGFHGHG